MYTGNPFVIGQPIVCIKDDFHFIPQYGGIEGGKLKMPSKGEILKIDEILGEFVRFKQYDEFHSYNWWYHEYFRALPLEKQSDVSIQESTVSVGL